MSGVGEYLRCECSTQDLFQFHSEVVVLALSQGGQDDVAGLGGDGPVGMGCAFGELLVLLGGQSDRQDGRAARTRPSLRTDARRWLQVPVPFCVV